MGEAIAYLRAKKRPLHLALQGARLTENYLSRASVNKSWTAMAHNKDQPQLIRVALSKTLRSDFLHALGTVIASCLAGMLRTLVVNSITLQIGLRVNALQGAIFILDPKFVRRVAVVVGL